MRHRQQRLRGTDGDFTTIQARARRKTGRDWIAMGQIPGPRVLTSLGPIQNANLTPDSLRAIVRGAKRRRRRHQDLRVGEHSRRRRTDVEGRALGRSGEGEAQGLHDSARPLSEASRRPCSPGAGRSTRRVCQRRSAQAHGRSRRLLRPTGLPRLPQLSRQPREVEASATTTGQLRGDEGDPSGHRNVQTGVHTPAQR